MQRPLILADRGFASLFRWLIARRLDFVIRLDKGTCLTEGSGKRHRLGYDLNIKEGRQIWFHRVRYALYHGRPNDIWLNVGLSWISPDQVRKGNEPSEPWCLAASLPSIKLAVAWCRRRFWIEESFRDDKSAPAS